MNTPHDQPRDTQRYFSTDHLQSDLTSRTARSGATMIVAQALKFILNLGSSVTLARLLSPQDYGLIAMVAVVTGFSNPLRDLGLSAATIQREKISDAQISNLFWLNLALSAGLMVATAAAAPLVAWFFAEPRLTWITVGLASGFIFVGLTIQHEALLRRQMQFFNLALVEIGSVLVGTMMAIGAAWLGMHYWALVLGTLSTSAAYTVGIWTACRWIPGWPIRNSGVRSMIAFGGSLTGYNMLNYVARNLDSLLIGRFWGAQQLGIYNRAYQLLLLPLTQISVPLDGIALTTLSRLRGAPERYRQAYVKILEKLVIITMPGVALMIATSDWLVLIVLGPQWAESARLFALLGILGLIEPAGNSVGWLLISQGRSREIIWWGVANGAISILSVLIGLPWGALGVAASYALIGVMVRQPILFWLGGRSGPVRTSDLFYTLAPASLAALSVLGALFVLRTYSGISSPLGGMCASSVVALVVATSVLYSVPAGRRALTDTWSLIPLLVRRADPPS